MKSIKKYLGAAALLLTTGAALTSCQNDFDQPPLKEPTATMKANTTIADLKAKYWQDDNNYYITLPTDADGNDIIVKGRVISSDATGNIYKSLVIQDETAALAFSINQTGMNNDYRLGQEVVVNLTELGFGKYAGLQQVGGYGEYNGTPQVSFMNYELFQNHVELNKFPNPEYSVISATAARPDNQMYCLEADLASLPTTPEEIRKWQSQLVIFRNVHFEQGGVATFSESDATTNRNLLDANGNSIIVRTSSYASFRSEILPAGTGDVMGILSYYNGTWQMFLRNEQDCLFDVKGQKSDPYTVAEAIENQGTGKTGWVSGYIVGSVKANVGDIDSNDKIIWGNEAEMDNTLVIGPTADCKDYTKCVILPLPQGSSLRQLGNLLDNPGNYGKAIKAIGMFDSYMGTNGLLDNPGGSADYEIEGVSGGGASAGDAVTLINENFDASTSIPAGWTSVKVKGDKAWYIPTFNNNNYAAMTGYKGTAPFESWLITPAINASQLKEKLLSFDTQVNGYGSTTTTFEVYVLTSADPTTATKTKLNPAIATAPASGYSSWVPSGELSLDNFSGVIYIGFCYSATTDANYATWCVDNVVVGAKAGTTVDPGTNPGPDPTGLGTEDNPYNVPAVISSTTDATGVWVEGYVVGWVSGMTWATGATFDGTPAADFTNTNCILGPTADAATTGVCIPAGIKAGSTRDYLGLNANPGIYKQHVLVKGDVTKYFGTRGVKNISEYKILD